MHVDGSRGPVPRSLYGLSRRVRTGTCRTSFTGVVVVLAPMNVIAL